ncbi:MAG: uroporphyrinogen-III synthase, partial [Chlamydiae bacterium]|nr:uroporphyrinogen-III synthase [Chlamydiota bacterium]
MNTILYLGTDPSHFLAKGKVIHCPVIRLVPKEKFDGPFLRAWEDLEKYTHIIFTSKNAVHFFFEIGEKIFQKKIALSEKKLLSIGPATSHALERRGYTLFLEAQESTQEGMAASLRHLDLTGSYIFYPRSSQARLHLSSFLVELGVKHQICDLYDTISDLSRSEELSSFVKESDEIIFTSPSTVKAFFEMYGSPPPTKKITVIGPITQEALQKMGR